MTLRSVMIFNLSNRNWIHKLELVDEIICHSKFSCHRIIHFKFNCLDVGRGVHGGNWVVFAIVIRLFFQSTMTIIELKIFDIRYFRGTIDDWLFDQLSFELASMDGWKLILFSLDPEEFIGFICVWILRTFNRYYVQIYAVSSDQKKQLRNWARRVRARKKA